eukprot:218326-Prymnesium_polylepis.2
MPEMSLTRPSPSVPTRPRRLCSGSAFRTRPDLVPSWSAAKRRRQRCRPPTSTPSTPPAEPQSAASACTWWWHPQMNCRSSCGRTPRIPWGWRARDTTRPRQPGTPSASSRSRTQRRRLPRRAPTRSMAA